MNNNFIVREGSLDRKWGWVAYYDILVDDMVIARVSGGHYDTTGRVSYSRDFDRDGNEVYTSFDNKDFLKEFHLSDSQKEQLEELLKNPQPALLWEVDGQGFPSWNEAYRYARQTHGKFASHYIKQRTSTL